MIEQSEFLFADGHSPELHLAHPLDDLFQAIEAAWVLPIGKRARITLRDPALPVVDGLLELARAPDLPLDSRQALALRVGGLYFTSREIAAWSLLE